MSEKRYFGFGEFSTWVSTKVAGALETVNAALSNTVKKDEDLGQYNVGQVQLSALLADLASGADLATLQQGFNEFVAAKATGEEAISGLDNTKYLTAATAKAAIDSAVTDLLGSAPEALDTIQELATALQNNPDVITELTTLVGTKLNTEQVNAIVGTAKTELQTNIDGKLGKTAQAADSALLGGSTKAQVVAQAVTAAETALADDLAGKLGTTAQAADSAKLEGRSKAEVMADTKAFLALGTASKSDIFVSTVDPISTDGKDGDLWIKYTP